MAGKIIKVLLILVGIALFECIRELVTFRITHYTIRPDALKGMPGEKKVMVLADLHNRAYGKQNERLLRAIRAQQPDIILIAGDMLVGKRGVSTEPAAAFIRELVRIAPVYYSNGNHEQRMKEKTAKYGDAYNRYQRSLTQAGVIFLENQSIDFNWGDVPVTLSGIEIPSGYYDKWKKQSMSGEAVERCLGKANLSRYQILIAHNPLYFSGYKEWGADLVVSGHLHGGIARIPGLRGVISTQGQLLPRYSGEMTEEDGRIIVVSRGLGTHTIHLRFLNMAEVVMLHIKGN